LAVSRAIVGNVERFAGVVGVAVTCSRRETAWFTASLRLAAFLPPGFCGERVAGGGPDPEKVA